MQRKKSKAAKVLGLHKSRQQERKGLAMKKSRAVVVLLVFALLLGVFGYTAVAGLDGNGAGAASSIKLGLDLAS